MRANVVLFATLTGAALLGCDLHDHHQGSSVTPPTLGSASPERVPPGVTAVQNEMRLLVEAMRTSVTAIGYGNLDAIPESLHAVHRARALTEDAIEKGKYELPKSPERLSTFRELDEQFHAELEKLVTAASAKDGVKTGAQLGVVMSKCAGCHQQFRP